MDRSFNYVHAQRMRAALTERDLAFLINQRSQSAIAQFEQGDRVPNLEAALALQVLFKQDAAAMFPAYFEWVEDAVMRRAANLLQRLETQTGLRATAKREFLERLAQDDNTRRL